MVKEDTTKGDTLGVDLLPDWPEWSLQKIDISVQKNLLWAISMCCKLA